MRPTFDQIQHAAYDRWLRRGRTHGHDRPDWFNAEKELTFLLNYRTIAEYPLGSEESRILEHSSIRRCRFCERTPARVAFSRAWPVVSVPVGNPSLFTAEICDDCQAEWRDPLDAEFRAFWEALAPHGIGSELQGQPQGRPEFSVAAFKSLIASAIQVVPEAELASVVDTIEWVSNPDHDCDDSLFAGARCQVYSAPFLRNTSWISLSRRDDAEAPFPYLLLFLCHSGIMVQVPVPLCLHDQDLDGRTVQWPERVLSAGEGPDFQETHGMALPLALSRRRSRRERRHPSLAP